MRLNPVVWSQCVTRRFRDVQKIRAPRDIFVLRLFSERWLDVRAFGLGRGQGFPLRPDGVRRRCSRRANPFKREAHSRRETARGPRVTHRPHGSGKPCSVIAADTPASNWVGSPLPASARAVVALWFAWRQPSPRHVPPFVATTVRPVKGKGPACSNRGATVWRCPRRKRFVGPSPEPDRPVFNPAKQARTRPRFGRLRP